MFDLQTPGSSAELAGRVDPRLLCDKFLRVNTARDVRSLEAEAARFTWDLGFVRYGVTVMSDDFSSLKSGRRLWSAHNTPLAYCESYNDAVLAKSDPVVQHFKKSSLPKVYDQDTYAAAGAGHLWEQQAPFGYAFGVGTALHLPRFRHVLFGVDTDDRPVMSRSQLTEIVARVQLFATFIQAAALSICDDTIDRPERAEESVRLSRREHECLQWAAEGKTAWETGAILSIAEGSVAKILASAIRKLDCATKPQAVVRALRLGLIH